MKNERKSIEPLDYFLEEDLESLKKQGQNIRKEYCNNKISLCTIVSGKTGGCSEDCTFCAQSIHRKGAMEETPLISSDELFKQGEAMNGRVERFSIVTSGRGVGKDFEKLLFYYKTMDEKYSFRICASHGFLTEEKLLQLKEVGVKRIHCNIETSENYFPNICRSHSFQDKVEMIKRAQGLGFEICSGGIIGLGESYQDRYEMALALRDLEVDSVPINILLPQKGTPLENKEILSKEEILRSLLIFRHLLPKTSIRIAAGRSLYPNFEKELLDTGVDAFMTGNLLTTTGSDLERDTRWIKDLNDERG